MLSREDEALESEASELQRLAAQAHTLEEAQSRLKDEGQQLADKLKLLNASHRNARCPLCDTPLGEEGCARMAANYEIEIRDKRTEYAQSQRIQKELAAKRNTLSQRLGRGQKSLQVNKQQAHRRAATLDRELEDSRSARKEAEKLAENLENLRHSISSGQFALDEQADLKACRASLQSLNYSPERHSQIGQKQQQLQEYQLLNQRLAEAATHLPQEENAQAQAQQAAQDRQEQLRQMHEFLASQGDEQARLTRAESQLAALVSETRQLEYRQKSLLAEQGQLQGSLHRIEELEAQIISETRNLRRIREEQSIYEELRLAFGRDGVQAMLIDTILPQIEEYANDLLARMTEGRMSVRLETQRPLQSRRGQMAETLEIHVSDELGRRRYEMFSGGEAFRINLALRIALSKVLANRSGAPLPTLFIDEGFGTQDSAGREQILDVLTTLEQDFKCIIVITHIEELKDYFPVRIEVQKRDGRSTVWIT